MKMNILSCVLVNCIFTLSSAFCSDVFITQNGNSINKSAISYCINNDNVAFLGGALNWPTFNIPEEYNISSGFHEYIMKTNLDSISEQLPLWYSILGYCKLFFILNESYSSFLSDISYDNLPIKCKKLLSRNINALKNKCNMQIVKKLSVLTAINTSWKDALSSIKEILKKDTPLSYDYKLKDIPLSHDYDLTEALFILHLKPSQSCINSLFNYFKGNNYKDKDVLFYAECITGALACVLKYEGRIPNDFKFDLKKDDNNSIKDDNEESNLVKNNNKVEYFIKNAKKLMQAYKDNFIEEQNKINIINNKNIKENNKNKVYNLLQDEEKTKLKQD